jgi:3-oxoadipate enol-lactonase
MELAYATYESTAPGTAVLLHSLALDGGMWEPLLDPLSQVRRLVVPDLRGHGKSPNSSGFAIEDMADDVAQLCDDLGLDRVAVVGMSMGGTVAQALAVRRPDLVEALGLIDTTAWYGPDAPAVWAQRAAKARADGLRTLSEFQLARWFSEEFRLANTELCLRLLNTFAANDLESYVSSCRAMGAADFRAALAGIDLPACVIVGEFDEATPVSHAEDLHERLSRSTLNVIRGSKHLTPYERPDEVATILARLLA